MNEFKKPKQFDKAYVTESAIEIIMAQHPEESSRTPGQLLTGFNIGTRIVPISNILQQVTQQKQIPSSERILSKEESD